MEQKDEFLTITDTPAEGFYSEKRSKFLAFAFHVTSEEEVKQYVAEFRKKYYDARHVCWAYMLGADLTAQISVPTTTVSRAAQPASPSSVRSTRTS